MLAWWQLGEGLTQAGGKASAWADQTGNGYTLIQATGVSQPVVEADGSLTFDGSNDWMFVNPIFAAIPQPFTLYALLKQITNPGDRFLVDMRNGSVALYCLGVTTQPTIATDAQSVTGAAMGNAWGTVAGVYDGASSVINVNGAEVTGALTDDAGHQITAFGIGGLAGSGALPSNTRFAEIILYSVAHDASDRADVITYLQGLPVA
jgi:hypothetical protein